jgi:regulator of protease activity HflC (stomatin/prohibitin superfamily)
MGSPKRVISSGLNYIFWPLESEKRFSTNLIELNFQKAGVITAAKEGFGEINIGLEMAMYFRWPEGNDLMEKTIKIISNPENIEGIANLFEETVLDTTRSIASSKTWKEIIVNRSTFSKEIKDQLIDEKSDLVRQAGIYQDTIRLAVKHLHLPENFENILTEPEIQRIKKEAAKHQAETTKIQMEGEGKGLRERTILHGQGIAEARRLLYDAIGNEPENIQKEILHTLREMAQGTSNTILFPIPTKLTDALENIFGKSGGGTAMDVISGLSKANQEKILRIIDSMKSKGA